MGVLDSKRHDVLRGHPAKPEPTPKAKPVNGDDCSCAFCRPAKTNCDNLGARCNFQPAKTHLEWPQGSRIFGSPQGARF